MQVELWPAERLEPYARDLKTHEKALPKMMEALRQWGFRVPLLVTGAGEIIDGKLRYLAAVQLGMQEIPVVVADDLTPTQVRTFRLLANRSATWADWNDEALRLEMAELRLELDDLRVTGFDDKELDALLLDTTAAGEKDPDDMPALSEAPVCREGQIWELGMHRLMCGDATSPADVASLMSGERADMVWIDPPYNVDYSGSPYEGLQAYEWGYIKEGAGCGGSSVGAIAMSAGEITADALEARVEEIYREIMGDALAP